MNHIDISYIVSQCARFVTWPIRDHVDFVKHIGRYQIVTRSKGNILRPVKEKVLEIFCDADSAVNWEPDEGLDRGHTWMSYAIRETIPIM